MKPTLQPSGRQVKDLELLIQLGDRISQAGDRLLEQGEIALSPVQIFELVEEHLNDWDDEQRNALVRQALSLRGLVNETGLQTSAVLEGLKDGLGKATNILKDQGVTTWDEHLSPTLAKLLDSKLFQVAAKSSNLAYDFAYLLQYSRVITDVRPVFDEQAEKIEGAVVSHVLRLKYSGRDSEHSLSVVLDAADVRRLRDECERALVKAKVVKQSLEKGISIPCHVTGSESEELSSES